MPRILKYLLYLILFIVSFALFLYRSLPYDILKDRIVGAVEKEMGGKYEIEVDEFSPYWLTGIDISGFSFKNPSGVNMLKLKKVRVRASILSLIFGSPKVSFDLDLVKGGASGVANYSDDEINLDLELDNVDLKNMRLITDKIGLMITSKIDGEIVLKVDSRRPIRSEGKISLDLDDMKIAEGTVKLGQMEMPLPEIILSKSSGSKLDMEMGKGAVQVKSFKLSGGDIEIDLKGKVFLSNQPENYRFNLSGSFKASEKVEKALPFLFIVEKQKKEDGSFPISMTGRLARPVIKVGNFNLPIGG
ncbi:MAG: type II secretion system protein GspN [Deltaproteobacteria bacterium]|jgi:type II secretion system protein N|nr:type II secretion system protein GspN [Deltaproteobacteria bacterium]